MPAKKKHSHLARIGGREKKTFPAGQDWGVRKKNIPGQPGFGARKKFLPGWLGSVHAKKKHSRLTPKPQKVK